VALRQIEGLFDALTRPVPKSKKDPAPHKGRAGRSSARRSSYCQAPSRICRRYDATFGLGVCAGKKIRAKLHTSGSDASAFFANSAAAAFHVSSKALDRTSKSVGQALTRSTRRRCSSPRRRMRAGDSISCRRPGRDPPLGERLREICLGARKRGPSRSSRIRDVWIRHVVDFAGSGR